MQEDFSVLIDPEDLYGIDTSALLIREEYEPNKFISMSEKLIPNFIRTYKNETNKYDDYL